MNGQHEIGNRRSFAIKLIIPLRRHHGGIEPMHISGDSRIYTVINYGDLKSRDFKVKVADRTTRKFQWLCQGRPRKRA